MAPTIDAIIELLGGAEAAARLTGVSTEAVRKWRHSGAIPSRHWSTVSAATGLPMAELRADLPFETNEVPLGATAALVLADGTVFWGRGFGAHTGTTTPVGEVCFNTGMTGYQETLTDPSYAGQIITFTFPHIGNVGTNPQDIEALSIAARGLVVSQDVTEPSNWRSVQHLDAWLRVRKIAGISGVDTRALTARIRDGGPPTGVLAFPADGRFDLASLRSQAESWPGLEGMDLAKEVTCDQPYSWDEAPWSWPTGFSRPTEPQRHVVAVDYGAKRNILRCLAAAGCKVTVVPATASAEDILRYQPDGVFLSNGPGDPAATGAYAVPAIQGILENGIPVFGICLGHQLLALALGAKTVKLRRGHRGANQPVQDLTTGKVEVTAQNHGFAVDLVTLPAGVTPTHVSLFDRSNEGLACIDRRAFSVQYHPEGSPGPSDSHYLFKRFVEAIDAHRVGRKPETETVLPLLSAADMADIRIAADAMAVRSPYANGPPHLLIHGVEVPLRYTAPHIYSNSIEDVSSDYSDAENHIELRCMGVPIEDRHRAARHFLRLLAREATRAIQRRHQSSDEIAQYVKLARRYAETNDPTSYLEVLGCPAAIHGEAALIAADLYDGSSSEWDFPAHARHTWGFRRIQSDVADAAGSERVLQSLLHIAYVTCVAMRQ